VHDGCVVDDKKPKDREEKMSEDKQKYQAKKVYCSIL
jgi:hypothetical protein